jgi:hypothetical protein
MQKTPQETQNCEDVVEILYSHDSGENDTPCMRFVDVWLHLLVNQYCQRSSA